MERISKMEGRDWSFYRAWHIEALRSRFKGGGRYVLHLDPSLVPEPSGLPDELLVSTFGSIHARRKRERRSKENE